MTSTDWSQIDSSAVEISPNSEVSTDLFGGDLFGDELLDMYSSSVNENNNEVGSIPNDIPNLLSMNKTVDEATAATPSKDNFSNDFGGLGALTQSPSLNDFSSLLNSPAATNSKIVKPEQAQQQQQPPVTQPVPKTEAPVVATVTKKRSRAENKVTTTTVTHHVGPVPINTQNKKRALNTNEKKGQQATTMTTVSSSTIVKTEDVKGNAQDNSNKDTPDPLTTATGAVVTMTPTAANALPQAPAPVTSAPAIMKVAPVVTNNTKAVAPVPAVKSVNSTTFVTAPLIQMPDVATSAPPVDNDPKTEESFKGVAQAAVTNLILSAGNNTPRFDSGQTVTDSDSESSLHLKPVNTSTQHVAALTSNNWVAACAASICNAPAGTVAAAQAAALAAASDPAAAKAARARRATLSADERAKQNRDRNREHARNTRLRKKAYVEELKRTLTELVAQRDANDLEKRHEKQRDLEVREVRYRVMEEFLKLRARGSESNLLARWVAILEDGFTLTLPTTEYRQMVENDNLTPDGKAQESHDRKVLRGATECLDDASKVDQFFNSLIIGSVAGSVRMSYHCDRKHFMMDGVNAILDWTCTTNGIIAQGGQAEIVLKGSMRATFSPSSNKLACAELMFDTGSMNSQLKIISTENQMNQVTSATNDLLDSVLPQVTTVKTEPLGMPTNVAIISNDKGESSSDEEGPTRQQHMIATA